MTLAKCPASSNKLAVGPDFQNIQVINIKFNGLNLFKSSLSADTRMFMTETYSLSMKVIKRWKINFVISCCEDSYSTI